MSRQPAQRSDLTSTHQPEQEHEMYDETPITDQDGNRLEIVEAG